MCCLIFFGTFDTLFQDSLINKKLKRTVFIQNKNFVLQYTLLFKSLGSVNYYYLFLKKLILLFSKDVLNGEKVIVKTYIVRKDFYFE